MSGGSRHLVAPAVLDSLHTAAAARRRVHRIGLLCARRGARRGAARVSSRRRASALRARPAADAGCALWRGRAAPPAGAAGRQAAAGALAARARDARTARLDEKRVQVRTRRALLVQRNAVPASTHC